MDAEMIIALSIALVAIGLVVLIVYLILTLNSLRQSLEQSNEVLKSIRGITQDIECKISSLDGLFDAVSGVSDKLRTISQNCCREEEEERDVVYKEKIPAFITWFLGGVDLWFKLRNKEGGGYGRKK